MHKGKHETKFKTKINKVNSRHLIHFCRLKMASHVNRLLAIPRYLSCYIFSTLPLLIVRLEGKNISCHPERSITWSSNPFGVQNLKEWPLLCAVIALPVEPYTGFIWGSASLCYHIKCPLCMEFGFSCCTYFIRSFCLSYEKCCSWGTLIYYGLCCVTKQATFSTN